MNQPKQDSEGLELRARPPRVARLSRAALAVLIGGASLLILLGTLWALRPPTLRDFVETELHNVDRIHRPEGIERLPRDYASLPPPPQLGAPLPGELGRPIARAEREAGVPPLPPAANFRPDAAEDAARTAQLEAIREADTAAKADILFRLRQTNTQRRSAVAETSRAAPIATPDVTSSNPANAQERSRLFTDAGDDRAIYGTGRVQRPVSADQLMAGTLIPAALLTGINSDLPGQAIAMVTEDVRDSVTGVRVLVPQGSRLIGRYDSQVSFGQRRLLLVWTRLIRPDGSSIALDKLPGTDAAGLAGLEDAVDWHWKEMLVGAALSTLIGIGSELAAPENRSGDDRIVIAGRQSAQDSVNQVGQQVTRRGLDVQPTLAIRPGYPLRVIVNRDLVLS